MPDVCGADMVATEGKAGRSGSSRDTQPSRSVFGSASAHRVSAIGVRGRGSCRPRHRPRRASGDVGGRWWGCRDSRRRLLAAAQRRGGSCRLVVGVRGPAGAAGSSSESGSKGEAEASPSESGGAAGPSSEHGASEVGTNARPGEPVTQAARPPVLRRLLRRLRPAVVLLLVAIAGLLLSGLLSSGVIHPSGCLLRGVQRVPACALLSWT